MGMTDRGRRTASVNGTVAAITLVVLAATAIVVKPPAPPTIAEFAPQAIDQIEDSPEGQSTGTAAASSPEGAREVVVREDEARADGPQGDATIEGVPSALQCVTWPDGSVTQSFDPQSPPCIATWDQATGNGGATARGVTGTDIVIAVPYQRDSEVEMAEDMAAYFSQAFQFYGRSIRIVPIQTTGSYAEDYQALAQEIIASGAFGTLTFGADTGSHVPNPDFNRRLAQAGVVVVEGRSNDIRSADHADLFPYLWSYFPTTETLQRLMAELVCKQLGAATPRYSVEPGPDERTLAVLVPSSSSLRGAPVPPTHTLLDGVAVCGHHPQVVEWGHQANDTQVMAQLKLDGVTSIISFLPAVRSSGAFEAAQSAAFHPEWILVGTSAQALSNYARFPPSQTRALFGLLSEPPVLPVVLRPESQAKMAVGSQQTFVPHHYRAMLMLASGIQMAGPQLTPDSFGDGLTGTAFPNPGAGMPPFHQGAIDYADAVALGDVALVWWNGVHQRPDRADPGWFCYIGGGSRWGLGSLPTEAHFFDEQAGC